MSHCDAVNGVSKRRPSDPTKVPARPPKDTFAVEYPAFNTRMRMVCPTRALTADFGEVRDVGWKAPLMWKYFGSHRFRPTFSPRSPAACVSVCLAGSQPPHAQKASTSYGYVGPGPAYSVPGPEGGSTINPPYMPISKCRTVLT